MSKQLQSKIKKRPLDLQCLATNRYGVVASTTVDSPGHPVKYPVQMQRLRQAAADLRKVRPDGSHCELVIEFPTNTVLKLVVATTAQGSLLARAENELPSILPPEAGTDIETERANTDSGVASDGARQGKRAVPSIAATALAEAEQLAAAAASISMAAVDVGHRVVDMAEKRRLTLEEAVAEFSTSPDEFVSRKTYARAGGPSQTINYSTIGERVLGGGHKVSAELHSANTFKLRRCHLAPGGRDGSFLLEGKDDDPEWQRLSDLYSCEFHLGGSKDSLAMQLLGYALASNSMVDVDVCISERASTKFRKLIPLAIHNRSEIVAGARDRLEFLEESSE